MIAILQGIGWDALNAVVFLGIVAAITSSAYLLCAVIMRETTDVDWNLAYNLTVFFGVVGSSVWAFQGIRTHGLCATLLDTIGILVVTYVVMALFLTGAALVGRWRYGKVPETYVPPIVLRHRSRQGP